MSKSIKLSPKHGVNPTIPVCFFCGEAKNEIALLGRIGGRDGLQAPMHMVLDYEPCDKCKEHWNEGVTLIEVNTYPMNDGQPPIAPNAYPTGRYVVVKPEALTNGMTAGQRALMLSEEFTQMFCSES